VKSAAAIPSIFSDSRPSNVAELLALIAEKDRLLAEREQLIDDHKQVIANDQRQIVEQQKLIKLLEEKLRLANQRRFGSSSEKLAFQQGLFDEAELEERLSELTEQVGEEEPSEPKPPRKQRRQGFSEKLPRVRIELTLSDEEKAGATNTFFTKVKEELDIIPAQARVLEYWQEKAVFETAEGDSVIRTASRSAHPLGKCIASVHLLAYILVAKYADALPLYRLAGIIGRYGGNISRTTLANWIIRLDGVFMPLIDLLREHQLGGDYLQADETRIQVLKEDGKVATSDKWMWVVRGGPPDRPAVLFHYDPTRRAEVPLRLFDRFSGVLQTDGCPSYNEACRQNDITSIGCWDHARRKFVEAEKAASAKGKGAKVSKANVAISKIRKLYAIEKRLKELPEEQDKTEQRRHLAQPVLDDLKSWLEHNRTRLPKDSLTGKAITYTLNQWEKLVGYLQDGRLNISNALAENAIRPFAVGRRNWLFADTSRGAKASATVYSLIETAKANDLEPYAYLCYVLERIGEADSAEKIEALLPWNATPGGMGGIGVKKVDL
jgi:transposase